MAPDNRPRAHGPARGTPRSRTVARPAERASRARTAPAGATGTATETPQAETPVAASPQLSFGVSFTRRALAVAVVLVILLLSYATSLRIYLGQQRDIAIARQQIADSTAKITKLEDEIARWQDPAYVRTQARERLGWVVPGETGYKVIDEHGNPLGGGTEIDKVGGFPRGEHAQTWWERMWGSVQTADNPEPVEEQ